MFRTPVRYSNWSNLEPDDGNIQSGQAVHNEDCAVINPTMDWSDVPCWNRFRFICKFLPDNGRAISFGGTLSYSDVGNKKYDEFAQGLKSNMKHTRPTIGSTKPVVEGQPKTRQKGNGFMMKGYNGQGPSRGGDKLLTSTMNMGKANTLRNNAGMTKGKEAGVKGGAAAAALNSPSAKGASVMDAGRNGLKQITNALNEAAKTVGTVSKNVKNAGDAALAPAKVGPGITGLGSIPGVTGAGINGNPGLGKIGGVEAVGGGTGSVQKGGNGNQSPISMKPGNISPQSTQTGSSIAGGGGSSKLMSPGANGGAPGHVATSGGLAQASPSGATAGGGGPTVGSNGTPAGATGGGGGGGIGTVPTGGTGGPAGGAGVPVGGSGAPTGGSSGGAQSGTMGTAAPAAFQSGPGTPGAAPTGGMGGGSQQLTPEQAAVAKQLANELAPQLARAYAKKFEPDMQMIQALCGKFCGTAVVKFQNSDPEQLGRACGKVCAESLVKGTPQDVMNMMGRLANEGTPQIVNNAPRGSSPEFSAKLPTGSIGGHMQRGENQPVGALSGNTGGIGDGNNSGGSNGGGNSGAGGGNNGGSSSGSSSSSPVSSNGGGGNGGGGNGGGGNVGGGNGGGGDGGGGNGINLNTLGSIVAPILGLNVEGSTKILPSGGQTLNSKVKEAIDSLKEQYNLKTNTASKSSTPGRMTEAGVEEQYAKGYFLLKKMNEGEVTEQQSIQKEKPSSSSIKNDTVEPLLRDTTDVATSKGYLKREEGPSSLGHVTGTKREMKITIDMKSSRASAKKSRKARKRRKHLGERIKRKHKRKYGKRI